MPPGASPGTIQRATNPTMSPKMTIQRIHIISSFRTALVAKQGADAPVVEVVVL